MERHTTCCVVDSSGHLTPLGWRQAFVPPASPAPPSPARRRRRSGPPPPPPPRPPRPRRSASLPTTKTDPRPPPRLDPDPALPDRHRGRCAQPPPIPVPANPAQSPEQASGYGTRHGGHWGVCWCLAVQFIFMIVIYNCTIFII